MRPKPKKSLGQNFLFDRNIINKIISACDFRAEDIVLEIGSGSGEISKEIAGRVKRLYAIEIDGRIFGALKSNLREYAAKITCLNQDILKTRLDKLIEEKGKIKIFGNIPYYITTAIIEYIIANRYLVDEAFLTVQKEFAQRVVATHRDKQYGSLSCFVQFYTQPKVLFGISRNCFRPAPKVGSSFLELKVRSHPAVATENEERFFRIIRAAFNQRRKTLKNSLKGVVPQEKLDKFFNCYKIDPRIRAERLSLQDFAHLEKI